MAALIEVERWRTGWAVRKDGEIVFVHRDYQTCSAEAEKLCRLAFIRECHHHHQQEAMAHA